MGDVERLEEVLVCYVAPTPILELHDLDIEGRILGEHRLEGVSEGGDVIVPGFVQRCVECDGLPVTRGEKERCEDHNTVEAEMKSDQRE